MIIEIKSIQWEDGTETSWGYIERYLIYKIKHNSDSGKYLLFPSVNIIYLDTSEFMKEIALASVYRFINIVTENSQLGKKIINIEWFIRNDYLIGSVNGKEIVCWHYASFHEDSEHYRKFSLFISYIGGIPEHRMSGVDDIRNYDPYPLAIGTIEQLKEEAQNLLKKFIEDICYFDRK